MRTEVETVSLPNDFKYKNPSGLVDILPDSQRYWHYAENVLEKIASDYGFKRLILPPIEAKSLYKLAFGNKFDDHLIDCGIEEAKEKYVFRAHPRVGIIRCFLENNLAELPPPFRAFTRTSVLRKFPDTHVNKHFFCLDVFGAKDVATSTNLFFLLYKLSSQFKLKNHRLIIYSNGCEACRPSYDTAFLKYAKKYKDELCPHCQSHISAKEIYSCNTCNQKTWLESAPSLLDFLCPACHDQLTLVLEMCDNIGIEYDVDPLSFALYLEAEQTTFGLKIGNERIPAIVGFSYDRVASAIAGRPIAATGITTDLHLLTQYLEEQKVTLPNSCGVQVFVAQLGSQAKQRCIPLLQQLFNAGYSVVTAGENDSITQQLQVADRLHARVTLIMGQKEAINGNVILRDMSAGTQDNIYLDDLIPALEERLCLYA